MPDGDSNPQGRHPAGVRCLICGEPVKWFRRDGTVLRRIEGWEEPRTEGGANKVIGRVVLGQWAHRMCVDAERFGGQGSLF